MIKDSLYHAIEQCNLKEIENISNELVKIDLDEPQSFDKLKNLLLLLSARHLFQIGHFLDAEIIITRILAIKLEAFQLYALLSVSPLKGNFQAILKHFNPKTAEDYVVFGMIYSATTTDSWLFNEAIVNFQKAIALSTDSDLYIYLGLQHFRWQSIEAINCFEKSIELNPNNELGWFALSLVTDRTDKNKIKYCQKAIELKPDFHRAYLELAFVYFYFYKMNSAWKKYEHRLEIYEIYRTIFRLFDPSKKWIGQSLDNKTIIVYCEQGLGDAIKFVRYIKALKEKYKVKVILQVFKELSRLFEPLADEIFTIEEGCTLPSYDYHISMLSLPYYLKTPTTEEPHFKVEPLDLGDHNGVFKIGICWTGSADNVIDIERSCHLKEFKPIYEIPGVKLFSLQKNKDKKYYPKINRWIDFSENPDNMDIVDLGSKFNDFLDAANAIASMDLIITVDTSVGMLAGSLGVPTWELIRYKGDWHWGIKGKTSPWFKSVKIYRQKQPSDWVSVIKKIKTDLTK